LKIFFKLFLLLVLLTQSLFGVSNYFTNKYNTAKRNYLSSVLNDNKTKEIHYLKRLVIFGKKINKDIVQYEKELNRLTNKLSKSKSQNKSKPKKKRTRHSLKSLFNNTKTSNLVSPTILFPKKQKAYKAILSNPKKYNFNKSQSTKQYSIKNVQVLDNSIVINFNKNVNKSFVKFEERKDKRNYFDTFYLKGDFKDAKPTKLKIDGIKKITISQYKINELKISLRSNKNLKTIYIVNNKQIVIKVLNLNNIRKTAHKQKTKVKLLNQNVFYPSKKIIVIDAGHGGKDSGAVGARRNYEKNIVLKVSTYLKRLLEQKGYKVYMTRSRDVYVKLRYRTNYANKRDADIFISIHANAARKSRAKKAFGIETYFLSPARSARAKRVASIENKGDMKNMGWSSKNSLLTVLNQAKITASNKMAIDIQRNMLYTLRGKYGKRNIRDGGVREGPFWVLVGAQMPSVLVEVGYVSHPKEGRRIATTVYQKRIASGIANGVESYFIKN